MSSEQPELKAGHPPAGKFSLHDYTHTHIQIHKSRGMSSAKAFATGVKVFDQQKVCLMA